MLCSRVISFNLVVTAHSNEANEYYEMDKKRKQEQEERHDKLFKALAKDVTRRLTLISNKSRLKPYIYGQPLQEPMVGKHFILPTRSKLKVKPVFDVSLSYVSTRKVKILGSFHPTAEFFVFFLYN